MRQFILLLTVMVAAGCTAGEGEMEVDPVPEADYSLTADQTHSRWSSAIEPVLRVPSASVIEVQTEEASDRQLNINSTLKDLENLSFDPIHPLTGPVYVEGAEPGDVLKVTLHQIEMGDWVWPRPPTPCFRPSRLARTVAIWTIPI